MNQLLEQATQAIYAYTFGMDTHDWEIAVSLFAEEIEVDYTEVGMPSARMTKSQLRDFLQKLLEKPDLRVHTAISQVLVNPANESEYIAYYTVRHYKGQIGSAALFAVFGWYSYRISDGLITSLKINVQAIEGNAAVLG